MPRITVWQEYRDEMDRAFQHIWRWAVPQGALAGLTGQARQRKIDELCQGEVQRTLREVRERFQAKLDKQAELDRMREGRAGQ